MIEKVKTWLLAGLVVISLLQSYFLAYSMPGLRATVSQQQDYVKTEQMGSEQKVEDVIFPEDMVLHLGKGKHTVLYPGTNFYNRIYEKLQSREFKGFEQSRTYLVDWDEVRERNLGIELRFGRGVPVELLSKSMKLEGDLQFLGDTINRIWIYKNSDREEVSAYFFSIDGTTVYESLRADLTAQDLSTYVGFGEYLTPYKPVDERLYAPVTAIQGVRSVVEYKLYTPEQMQRNLFFDPGVTRAISDRSGSQIYTDGKKGMQVEQNGKWISYTDPVAGQGIEDKESENIEGAVSFVNDHGGWDGLNRLQQAERGDDGQVIRFQQYYLAPFYGALPIVPQAPFLFGEIRIRIQQGVVSEYERSLITLSEKPEKKEELWLPGGAMLTDALAGYARRSEVEGLYPAYRAIPVGEGTLRLDPVWAVRLTDGTQDILMQALPAGYKPPDTSADSGGAASDGVGSDGAGAAAKGAAGAGASSGKAAQGGKTAGTGTQAQDANGAAIGDTDAAAADGQAGGKADSGGSGAAADASGGGKGAGKEGGAADGGRTAGGGSVTGAEGEAAGKKTTKTPAWIDGSLEQSLLTSSERQLEKDRSSSVTGAEGAETAVGQREAGSGYESGGNTGASLDGSITENEPDTAAGETAGR